MNSDRITPAALLVTGSLCLIAVMCAAAVCWEFVETGDLNKDGVAFVLALVAATSGLLARTWREPTPDPHTPQPVTTVPGEPLAVVEAKPDPVHLPRLGGVAS